MTLQSSAPPSRRRTEGKATPFVIVVDARGLEAVCRGRPLDALKVLDGLDAPGKDECHAPPTAIEDGS
jgi:hypothetical protein